MSPNTHIMRVDVHQAVTSKIVAVIENGAGAWHMPWHRRGVSFAIPKNASTQRAYRGTNIRSLWIDAHEKGFEHQIWATYRQWQGLGFQVRQGEKGSLIVKYGEWTPKNAPASNDEEEKTLLFAKAAYVFNAAQVQDYPFPPKPAFVDLTERLEDVEAFIAAAGAVIEHSGNRAYYRRPPVDRIVLPPRELFTGTASSTPTEAYYATKLHELSHWSGAEHRLNREFGERFGDKAYCFEELVAELAAAFLCAELQITNTPRMDHAQYIGGWLEILKEDKKAVFTAASAASRACAYLMDLQPSQTAYPSSTLQTAHCAVAPS